VSIHRMLIRPDNRLTTCPPGRLVPGTAPIILIASLRRSGTHLLIDAILNNFAAYKRHPLHVNLDQYLRHGYDIAELIECGGYVVKTHFPQKTALNYEQQVRAVAEHAIVLTPVRAPDEVYRSAIKFGASMDEKEFTEQIVQFEAFWKQYHPLLVPFVALTTHADYESLLATIGQHIGLTPNRNPVFPFSKDQRTLVYLIKLLTRTLGRYSPVVNTTISFAKA
jgi:hypothetical protein